MEREIICISCPVGCSVRAKWESKEDISFFGNKCKKGEVYVKEEITAPKRVVTSTVRVENGVAPTTSVKTNGAIPKEKIFEVMKEVNKVRVIAPVKIKDIVIKDVCGTNVDIIVTRDVEKNSFK